ncbi:MAG: DNA photolyase [Thermodesulfobacteriota bacterium]|nr:DNA photolyase [Thermodesulfobacteriota bacterium]
MRITTIYIDKPAEKYSESASIIHNLQSLAARAGRAGIPVIRVEDASAVYQAVSGAPDSVETGKQVLFLTTHNGRFLKPCPGTRYYRCCGYQILNIAGFCSLDCSYCILQAYFHPPVLQCYVNQADMFKELDRVLGNTGRVMRIGTGEFTDSLIWNDVTDLTRRLIDRFSVQDRAVLELKTKTVNIEPLRRMTHNRKTIAAWSLNTETVIRTEERGSASLSQRLEAAAACEQMGYPLAFHFDPIILYDGCEAEYKAVIEHLFASVSPENVVWISLGTFRFMPALKPLIEDRFPSSTIAYGEFVAGMDRKMRYFKPLRIRIYKAIIAAIRAIAPDVLVYFCMEDDEVWEKCMGFVPAEQGGLPAMLDQSAVARCNLSAAPHIFIDESRDATVSSVNNPSK